MLTSVVGRQQVVEARALARWLERLAYGQLMGLLGGVDQWLDLSLWGESPGVVALLIGEAAGGDAMGEVRQVRGSDVGRLLRLLATNERQEDPLDVSRQLDVR